MTSFSRIEEGLEALVMGLPVIVLDSEERENEGDLVMGAELATAEAINFMSLHGRGLVCLALESARVDELRLPPMVNDNRSPNQTAFTASIAGSVSSTSKNSRLAFWNSSAENDGSECTTR